MMRDNALYFPLISVPPSRWVLNTLLYWDNLQSIVPLDHVFSRADGGFMSDLVQLGLVKPIFPREHLYQIPDYERAFLEYLKPKRARKVREIAKSRQPHPRPVPVHMEKLQGLGDEFVRLGLARRIQGDWFELELWVANRLMTFLAAALGRLESVGAAPITDDPHCFRLLAGNAALSPASESRVSARAAILEKLLPVPIGTVNLADLAKFKTERGAQLKEFRREIENRCVAIAQADPADRADALALVVDDLTKQRDEIAKKMRDRWKDVTLNPLCSVIGAGVAVASKPLIDSATGMLTVTGAGLGLGLVGTVYRAYRSNKDYVAALNKPMAYAASFSRRNPTAPSVPIV